MWSFGVIFYILLGGCKYYSNISCFSLFSILFIIDPPFTGNKKHLPGLIMEGKVEFHHDYWSHVSDAAKNLIKGLLEVNPSKRFTAEQALNHRWIQEKDEELDKHTLNSGLIELRKHLARRKLRALLRAVLMTQRLRRLSFITRRSISGRSIPSSHDEDD